MSQGLGIEARLISPQFVSPFVKANDNDRNDAEAIGEAASRRAHGIELPVIELPGAKKDFVSQSGPLGGCAMQSLNANPSRRHEEVLHDDRL